MVSDLEMIRKYVQFGVKLQPHNEILVDRNSVFTNIPLLILGPLVLVSVDFVHINKFPVHNSVHKLLS